jgi:hypothetical protein
MWQKLASYVKRYPARVAGYISAVLVYVNKSFPNIPVDIIIPTIMFIVGIGESAQRVENKKTIKALYVENDPNTPDEEIINKLNGAI